MKTVMGRKKKTPEGAKTWEERKAKFFAAQIHRDIGEIASTLAKRQKMTMAEFLDPLLREPLLAMWKEFGKKIVEDAESDE